MPPTKPLFTVVPPNARNAKVPTPFALHRDRWDDFGYKTQYQLMHHEADEETYIGNVKILQKGQRETRQGLLEDGPHTKLDTDFCSLGQTLDYYERVAALPLALRTQLIKALRDVVQRPALIPSYRKEPGWTTSILRDIDDLNEFTSVAAVLLSKDYSSLVDVSLDLTFKPSGWKKALELNFDTLVTQRQAQPRYRLPKRIAVLVGRNGSGKSTLLARFARVAHAPRMARRREPIRSLGTLMPRGVGFTRIIAISYSAFDSFQIPGVTVEERRQIARDVDDGTGRYIFCGLRDIAAELHSTVSEESDEDLEKIVEADDLAQKTLLKPIEKLADEFVRTLERIRQADRWDLLEDAAAPLLNDPSFGGDDTVPFNTILGSEPRETFLRWSTGHKIVIQIVTALVAYTQPKAIVLLDEPETHLHPPLLAALMHGVRFVLEKLDAFAIVATHSPVVAQESLARHVHILRRSSASATITAPRIETFGESIGEVSDEIFGLNSDATDFHEILKRLTKRLKTLEAVDAQFDHGLSMQARAYVMSLIATDDDN
ncbi:ATP-binding protein [Mesorhizobium ciceri]|uniref:ATP-binding protein n=1 Tax=Mesorhizobium TaxID=68287 RepID=UPI0004B211B7|nr:ATP-binding protein [Mesorhizobium ciceri]